MFRWICKLFQKEAPKKSILWVLIDYDKWNGLQNADERSRMPVACGDSTHIQHIENLCTEYLKTFKIPVGHITYSTERPARRSDGFWIGLNGVGYAVTLEL